MTKRFHPVAILWLVVMWILLWGDLSIGNLIAGLILAFFITSALPMPVVSLPVYSIHWPKLFWLMLNFHKDLILSSVRVARIALRRAPQPPAAIVRLPFDIHDDLIFAFGVALLNLQPGGTVTNIIMQERAIVVHLLDGSSESTIAREIAGIEKLQTDLKAIFPHARAVQPA